MYPVRKKQKNIPYSHETFLMPYNNHQRCHNVISQMIIGTVLKRTLLTKLLNKIQQDL